jgi:hypothetical protein
MIAGQNGLLFAYGITNSGKTYTIQGVPEKEGIVPRMLMDLFGRLERQQAGDGAPYHVLVTAHAQALYSSSVSSLRIPQLYSVLGDVMLTTY